VLEGIRVEEVYQRDANINFIPELMSLDDIVHTLAETQQHYFPVTDQAGKMVGVFSSDDMRLYLYDETIWHLAVARDVMMTDIVSVTPEDDLNTALRRFTALNLDELPVLDPQDPGKLLDMLRRKETIAFYNRQVLKHKQEIDSDSTNN
jgi:CIC family chloride channel protein